MGYTSSIAVGVWVGNNNSSMSKEPGVVLAGPILHNFMQNFLQRESQGTTN
jgi:membrane peptidoglycan carboxypeptidase